MLYLKKLIKSGEKGIDVTLNSKDVPKLATDIAKLIITIKYKNLEKLVRKYLENFEKLSAEDIARNEGISKTRAEDFLYLLYILFTEVTVLDEISEHGKYTFPASKLFGENPKKKTKSKSAY